MNKRAGYLAGTSVAIAAAMLLASGASAQTGKPHPATGKAGVLYSSINPHAATVGGFEGDVNPSWRRLRSWWGDVNPYWRRLRSWSGDSTSYAGTMPVDGVSAFWGDLEPVWRRLRSWDTTLPDPGQMGAFWENNGTLWTQIDATWASGSTDPNAYAAVGGLLNQLSSQSEGYFGAAVAKQTGKSFAEGFANPLFAKHGIDPANAASLAGLAADQRAHFFMDWYDGLMRFAGTDHVDHWMGTANWNPRLTQIQGSGSGVTIGLVDFFVAGDTDIQSKTILNKGVSTFSNGHGAAVGGLMVSAHDGKGVMGIAPNARIAAFNPFDATGTASWAAVTQGVAAVTHKDGPRASVVNMSLGVSGTTFDGGWRDVFKSSGANDAKDRTIYVIAAGNDGITQTANVNMKDAFDSTFLVVGSVDPTGRISDFSNRPGNACLTDDATCKNSALLKESGKLMNRFIVAPGELILVSDDKGGIVRASGTSFSAPLVSGAIALIHDRWPWLKQKPLDTAHIILRSARDLGAPGIDPVYGVGMLDVEASQSPLNFGALKYYTVTGTRSTELKMETLLAKRIQASWEADGVYFTAFEKLDGGERDFLIPLSSRLVGQTRGGEHFQDYIYTRFQKWIGGGALTGDRRMGLSDLGDRSRLPNPWGLNLAMTARLTNPAAVRFGADARMATAVHLSTPGGVSLAFGSGDGAPTLGAQSGFGLASDYDPQLGGVNPVLGFASGGAFARAQLEVSPGLHLSLGATEQTRRRGLDLTGTRDLSERMAWAGLDRYKANAANLRVDYRVNRALAVSASLTRLNEASGLLGVRSMQPTDLAGGSTSDAVTLGADLALPHGIALSVSGTGAKTTVGDAAAIRTTGGGLLGTYYQVGLAKTGVLGRADTLRLSVAQPLTVEGGSLEFTERRVIDRETGETGFVTNRFGIGSQARRYVVDGAYATSLLGDMAEVAAFGRGEFGGADRPVDYVAGVRGRIAFWPRGEGEGSRLVNLRPLPPAEDKA